LNRWGGLVRFLDDGIEMDTNSVERAMRSIPGHIWPTF
jgi:hypothetical protein